MGPELWRRPWGGPPRRGWGGVLPRGAQYLFCSLTPVVEHRHFVSLNKSWKTLNLQNSIHVRLKKILFIYLIFFCRNLNKRQWYSNAVSAHEECARSPPPPTACSRAPPTAERRSLGTQRHTMNIRQLISHVGLCFSSKFKLTAVRQVKENEKELQDGSDSRQKPAL